MKNFFRNMINSFTEARQLKVDYEVAKELQKNEYRNESVGAIFGAIRNGNLDKFNVNR